MSVAEEGTAKRPGSRRLHTSQRPRREIDDLPSIAVLIFMLPGVLLMGFACFREWDFLLLFPDALLFYHSLSRNEGVLHVLPVQVPAMPPPHESIVG